jgi:hypothetical protein
MKDFTVDADDYRPQPEDDHNRDQMEIVALGQEARNFLSSKMADYICSYAENLSIDAHNKLLEVDPTDVKGIIRLQTEAKLFANFNRCLVDIVTAGDSAYQAYLAEIENSQE